MWSILSPDIRLDSVQYFKNSFAFDDKYRLHSLEEVSKQAKRHNAILAINSDDCGYKPEKTHHTQRHIIQ